MSRGTPATPVGWDGYAVPAHRLFLNDGHRINRH
jgi:hypothetical protein